MVRVALVVTGKNLKMKIILLNMIKEESYQWLIEEKIKMRVNFLFY